MSFVSSISKVFFNRAKKLNQFYLSTYPSHVVCCFIDCIIVSWFSAEDICSQPLLRALHGEAQRRDQTNSGGPWDAVGDGTSAGCHPHHHHSHCYSTLQEVSIWQQNGRLLWLILVIFGVKLLIGAAVQFSYNDVNFLTNFITTEA